MNNTGYLVLEDTPFDQQRQLYALKQNRSSTSSILLCVGNAVLHKGVELLLQQQQYEIITAATHSTVLDCFQQTRPSLIILEAYENSGEVFAVAEQVRQWDKRLPMILVTMHGSEALAIRALRLGFKEYFKYPFSQTQFIPAVQRCVSNYSARHVQFVNTIISPGLDISQLVIGESLPIRKIRTYLTKAAAVDSHMLITGETGTGKELTAQSIHQQSARRGKPFIAINCAALPDGLLESELFGYEKGAFTGAHAAYAGKLRLANGGTVFFDEIGDMSPYAQAKILRMLESKEVYPLGGKRSVPLDVRIIAATNRQLERMVITKEFREDLYYRLNVGRVQLPALRERKEDIPHLLNYYLKVFNQRFDRGIRGFTDEAMERLISHHWSGNVRELKNLLEAIFIDPPVEWITVQHLPETIDQTYRGKDEDTTRTERELLLSTLHAVNWNRGKAAEKLHWSRMTLYRKMVKYHMLNAQSDGPLDPSLE